MGQVLLNGEIYQIDFLARNAMNCLTQIGATARSSIYYNGCFVRNSSVCTLDSEAACAMCYNRLGSTTKTGGGFARFIQNDLLLPMQSPNSHVFLAQEWK